ncbi:MAG TPA: hypothetical protein VJ385_00255 [Fibrobacteria bacterium]|nr:hypothetical protein [Fibrobacteria bacterium]
MRKNHGAPKILLPGLVLAGFAWAEDNAARDLPAPSKESTEAASPSRKAYDALFFDILKALPQEGKSKVDSARGRERDAAAKPSGDARSPEDLRKDAIERRKKNLEELPPDVKARVDKVLSGLDNRRKEKQTEFKELK